MRTVLKIGGLLLLIGLGAVGVQAARIRSQMPTPEILRVPAL